MCDVYISSVVGGVIATSYYDKISNVSNPVRSLAFVFCKRQTTASN